MEWSKNELTVLKSIPSDTPLIVKPNPDKLFLSLLRKTVADGASIGALNEEEINEWHAFLANEDRMSQIYDEYPLLEAESKRY